MIDTIILGAGPAGLARAFWLAQQDPTKEIAVLESKQRPGGMVHTEQREGYTLEWGPQALRSSTELDALADALGARAAVCASSPKAKTKWLARDDRLVSMPSHPLGAVTSSFLNPLAKLRAFGEPWLGRTAEDSEESLASFVERRFGPALVPLVQAAIGGIYAGDATELEAKAAMPVLTTAEAAHRSVLRGMRRQPRTGPRSKRLLSFAEGMSELPKRLAAALGKRVHYGRTAETVYPMDDGWGVELDDRVVPCKNLILATPAWQSARFLAGSAPKLGAELSNIPYCSVVNVWISLPAHQLTSQAQGFGFLIDPREKDSSLGAIYCSSLFPWHAPQNEALFRVMLGGSRHPEVLDMSDEELINTASSTLRRYLHHRAEPRFCAVARIPRAIPQYVQGHSQRVQVIGEELTKLPGLELCGNSYKNIALGPQLAAPAS